jgi:hypothetical protein
MPRRFRPVRDQIPGHRLHGERERAWIQRQRSASVLAAACCTTLAIASWAFGTARARYRGQGRHRLGQLQVQPQVGRCRHRLSQGCDGEAQTQILERANPKGFES